MDQTNRKHLKAAIESILFAMGGAVPAEKLQTALEISHEDLAGLIWEMQEACESGDRGVRIIELDGSYQMTTKQETYEQLIKIVALPKQYRLSDVQLEALSIIAYKQPITKIEIERIRGVQSDHAVNRLIEAGLVEEKGRLNSPGRPILLGTTEEFLRRFGLSSRDDLPDINSERVETFRMEAEEELGYYEDENGDSGEDEILTVES